MVLYSMVSMLSMVFHGFIFHAFMGNTVTTFLSHASMESMELTPWKPWNFALAPCSMVFKGIHGIFPMLFPWFFHGFPMLSIPGQLKRAPKTDPKWLINQVNWRDPRWVMAYWISQQKKCQKDADSALSVVLAYFLCQISQPQFIQ